MYGEDIAIISICVLILVLVVFFNSCHLHHSEENHRTDSSYLARIIEILEQEEVSRNKTRNLPQQYLGSLPVQERRPVQSVREGEVPGPLRQAGLHPVTQTVKYTTLPLQSDRRGVSSFQPKGGKSVHFEDKEEQESLICPVSRTPPSAPPSLPVRHVRKEGYEDIDKNIVAENTTRTTLTEIDNKKIVEEKPEDLSKDHSEEKPDGPETVGNTVEVLHDLLEELKRVQEILASLCASHKNLKRKLSNIKKKE